MNENIIKWKPSNLNNLALRHATLKSYCSSNISQYEENEQKILTLKKEIEKIKNNDDENITYLNHLLGKYEQENYKIKKKMMNLMNLIIIIQI